MRRRRTLDETNVGDSRDFAGHNRGQQGSRRNRSSKPIDLSLIAIAEADYVTVRWRPRKTRRK